MGNWNPAFGRKLIFINPGFVIKNYVITALLEMEYEVYYTEEPRYTKALLRAFPDSICFFDIDSGMSEDEYLHLILSIENDPAFSNVLIGVISRKIGTTQRNFMTNVELPAGYLPRSGNKEELLEAISAICELNDVRGRRQYVRISIPEGSEAVFACTINSTIMRLPIKDISTCGFACDAIGYAKEDFTINSIVQGKLMLGQLALPCNAVLYALNPSSVSVVLVLLFTPKGNPLSMKKNIKAFSAIALQKVATAVCVRGGLDSTDYTKKPENAEKVEVLADLEECDDFYADDDNQSGLSYTSINSGN